MHRARTERAHAVRIRIEGGFDSHNSGFFRRFRRGRQAGMSTEGPDLAPLYDVPGLSTLVSEQDLVCNHLVAQERNEVHYEVGPSFRLQPSQIARRIGGSVIFFALLFVALFLYVGLVMVQCSFCAWYVSLLLGLGEALAYFPFIFGLMGRLMSYPTNVMLSSYGFAFKRCEASTRETTWFPWQAVSWAYTNSHCIDALGELGPAVVLEIDTKKLSKRGQFHLFVDCCVLWLNQPFPWMGTRGSQGFNIIPIRIPLLSFTLESDQVRLLSAVRANLPEESVDQTILERLEQTPAPSFTQLWLDDSQSFRRMRIESLVEGTKLQEGRYEMKERLASGGQATVYLANDKSCEPSKLVALKEFVLPVNAGTDVRDRSFNNVKNEALLLASLSHPGIVKLLDNFVEDHRAYLVLENIEGSSLRDSVLEGKPFAESQVVELAVQLCEIL